MRVFRHEQDSCADGTRVGSAYQLGRRTQRIVKPQPCSRASVGIDEELIAKLVRHSDAVVVAALRKMCLLNTPEANLYQADYNQGEEWGVQLRRWRSQHQLEREEAAQQLLGWDALRLALLEEGLLAASELSGEMTSSLRAISIGTARDK